MTRSLRKRLGWWHTGLFAAAIIISVLLAWKEMSHHNEPGGGYDAGLLRTAAEACVPFLVTGAVSWIIIYRTLAPIEKLTAAAEEIHADSLHKRLPLRGSGDELDRLTSVLNDMTERLEEAFSRVREFSLHASHELKTPLTILRNGFEQTLRQPDLSPALSEQLLSWLDEVDRLNRIVSGLTLLTQADARQVALCKEPVTLHELVKDAAAEAEILGAARSLQIRVSIPGPVETTGDRHRLRQLLLNLTDNAVKYNHEDGFIEYALTREKGFAVITVSNSGRGIPPTELPHIFDRFYRSSTSRGTVQEGIGLGLSIAKWIAEAHGGSLTAASRPGLTVLTLRLPERR